ncbi:hypothetical protein HHI36_006866 [Cryptolaemus montrouzieri]|uniref:Xylose isomerase-like TIM barrel domain-containing protein n=1 Tax=Cryptolaemus montrouzieri TaxID=559131 RepID=A0ABD2MNB6_9CUCU
MEQPKRKSVAGPVHLANAQPVHENPAGLSPQKKLSKMQVRMKFCANLAFLFTESSFLERYQLAKNAGFKCVETGFPVGLSKEQVAEAKKSANVEQVLINVYTGDVSKGELGFAAIPGKEQEFKDSIQKTIEYAKALGARKIHIMSGKLTDEVTKANDEVYEKNLKYAVKLLEKIIF